MNTRTETGSKWALITGAGRRVGAEIAHRLAMDGYNIYLHFRSSQTEAEGVKKKIDIATAKKVQVELVTGDLSKKEEVQKLFEVISPDVVIHNAAIFEESKRKGDSLSEILEAEDEAFNKNMGANAKAVLLVTAAAMYRMRKDKKTGTFILVGDASIHGTGKVYPSNLGAYTMSKAYIPPYTHQRGVELGEEGFRFLAVLNGPIDPPPTASEEAIAKVAGELNVPPEDRKPWIGGVAVAEAVSSLLQMPSAVNGISVPVDGARGEKTPREH